MQQYIEGDRRRRRKPRTVALLAFPSGVPAWPVTTFATSCHGTLVDLNLRLFCLLSQSPTTLFNSYLSHPILPVPVNLHFILPSLQPYSITWSRISVSVEKIELPQPRLCPVLPVKPWTGTRRMAPRHPLRPIRMRMLYLALKKTTSHNFRTGTTLQQIEHTVSEKVELTEEDCYDQLGYAFPEWRKWMIIIVIFLVQTSMNFNTSLYSNAAAGISEEFGVSMQAARCGAMIFLVLYAFGCELWAPWSEELGRKPILQLSLFLVNVFQLPVALAPNFASIMVGRALGGLSSAGGSVTLGMIADLWEADDQQYAVACVVFSSVGGSALGPVVGGFVEAYLPWRWNIWIQLIFGGFVQIAHLLLVPETRTTIMMDRIAKKKRESGENPHLYGPNELVSFRERFSAREILVTWVRPFKMFLTEPIVLCLSLLSGFSDALIFIFIQSFGLVYDQWNFSTVAKGLAFIPILIGYFIAWLSFIPVIRRNIGERRMRPDDEHTQYESRLWWLLYTAPCLPIGLIGFAWTSLPHVHWIGTMIFSAVVGIANYSIYMATIDYMICAYGPYSASATGGNGWSRDFLAGVLTIPATPFYTNIGGERHLEYASTILFCISFILVIAVYVIYWYGPTLRKRSPFAQQLSDARVEIQSAGRRLSKIPSGSRANSFARSQQNLRIRQNFGSRPGSYVASRGNSRNNSLSYGGL